MKREFILKGITFESIIDFIHSETKEGKKCPEHEHPQKWVTELPGKERFSMPMTTNIPCWWCMRPFRCPPMGAPIEYDDGCSGILEPVFRKENIPFKGKMDFFVTTGVFCSLNCAYSFVLDESAKGNLLYKNSIGYLYVMAKKQGVNLEKVSKRGIGTSSNGDPLNVFEFPNIRRPYIYPCSVYYQSKTENSRTKTKCVNTL